MKTLLILCLIIFLFACNRQADKTTSSSSAANTTLGTSAYFDTTGFSGICNNVVNSLQHAGHGDYFTVTVSNGTYIDRDSLARIIETFIPYDIKDSALCNTFIKTCPGLKTISWKMNSPASPVQLMERITFKTWVTNAKLNTKYKISITDFTVKRSTTPRLIKLRVVNDSTIEDVVIDSISYHPLSESRLLSLDTMEEELDNREKKCE